MRKEAADKEGEGGELLGIRQKKTGHVRCTDRESYGGRKKKKRTKTKVLAAIVFRILWSYSIARGGKMKGGGGGVFGGVGT